MDIGDFDHNRNYTVNSGYEQVDDNQNAIHLNQQKRQGSLTNYMLNNSNKRTINTQQVLHGDVGGNFNNVKALSNTMHDIQETVTPVSRFNDGMANNPQNNSVYIQHMHNFGDTIFGNKATNPTPTPSSYEMPVSPKVNQVSNVSPNNNSDSSDSNPLEVQNSEGHVPSAHFKDASVREGRGEYVMDEGHESSKVQQNSQGSKVLQKSRIMTEEEQQLATKLKETYKNIVNYEEILQKNCMEISIKINNITNTGNVGPMGYNSQMMMSQLSTSVNSNTSMNSRISKTSILSNDLWAIYYSNTTLLDNYYDFFITALKPTSNSNQFRTGKNIIELYKIPRRMWVYGVVGFLEILKNIMGIFNEHEICSCFIAYCFNIISNLTDPMFEMEGWWAEKLGDLSRMAIALYYSRLIDWKVSAEYWYSLAMRTMYGHGKIYYHMCTVQQDNLEALVNIGKSVMCNDPFVPTQQYLRLVVENICTQRVILSLLELPVIDFIKIHKVLLTIHFGSRAGDKESGNLEGIRDSQLQYGMDLVTRYGLTFGSDSNGYNFFTKELYHSNGMSFSDSQQSFYLQQQQTSSANSLEKVNFWFNKGPLFALANINHLIGFGDSENPFAKLFELPEALKERKYKKDKKRKSRSVSSYSEQNPLVSEVSSSDNLVLGAEDLSRNDWFAYLKYINKSVLEVSVRILRHYLVGPRQASTGHVIVWLYFLIAVGEAIKKYPNSEFMFYWLLRKLLPMESLINYLNSILSIVNSNQSLHSMLCNYLIEEPEYIEYFNSNEFLPEVWKCWGTLWFDTVTYKSDYMSCKEAGVSNYDIFDLPSCGNSSTINQNYNGTKLQSRISKENEERIVRVLLLARYMADNYNFGIVRGNNKFQFDKRIYSNSDSLNVYTRQPEVYSHVESFLLEDNRFIQNNFLEIVSSENLIDISTINFAPNQKDEKWFNLSNFKHELHNSSSGREIRESPSQRELNLERYEESDFGNNSGYDPTSFLDSRNFGRTGNQFRHLEEGEDLYYQGILSGTNQSIDQATPLVEGDLGDRMDSGITYITLDTNVWLKHCGRVYTCVHNKIIKVQIPLIVFQELRLLRKSAEATISDAATRSVIIIRELYASNNLVPLRSDGTVASDINETLEFENNPNWRANIDDIVLNSLNQNDESNKKMMKGLNLVVMSPFKGKSVLDSRTSRIFRYCILITDDRNMRLRAKALGLTSFQSKWLFSQLEAVFPQKCID